MSDSIRVKGIWPFLSAMICSASPAALWLEAHELHGHHGPTYEMTAPLTFRDSDQRLILDIVDADTGQPTAARFSLRVDGETYEPHGLGARGLRFVSIHTGKKQQLVACYARGTGAVEVPLPARARGGVVTVVKGFEFLPVEVAFRASNGDTKVAVRLRRWSNLRQQGWAPAEEHLHYDRISKEHDRDWLTLLAGDDLVHAHFLVLKGGNLPGIWAQQYAYGEDGEAFDGERLIRPGEEYRDSFQGHINLLGVREVIPPISTGGMGQPHTPYHYPAFYDVLQTARQLDGLGGPAHGTALGRSPTGVVDTVLGAVDFFEIANTHLYNLDVWYPLMNCGYIVPPAAGTDLPNFPFREPWQPLLGETRMYVRVGKQRSYQAWKSTVRRGEVFVTSGPLITFQVGGAGPGGIINLRASGEVRIEAELASPRPLKSLEVVQNGTTLGAPISQRVEGKVHRWRIDQRIRITRSCWLAARGQGVPKRALEKHSGIQQNTIAHTAAVRVIVGDQPITSPGDAEKLVSRLGEQREFYRTRGKYQQPQHQKQALQLFDSAIKRLRRQTASESP